jgi:Putative peptidoglycan binding domain/Transglycosylase SLT domain
MPFTNLRLYDGYQSTSPELKEQVKKLQQLLIAAGYPVGNDGCFGPNTHDAVIRFQRDRGLDDDGIVDAETWSELQGVPATSPPPSFPTNFLADHASLLEQNQAAEQYRSFIEQGANQHSFPTCLIVGIGSRESHWGLILKPRGPAGTGDTIRRPTPRAWRPDDLPPDGGGFGRGLMQIDYDAHPFARGSEWKDPGNNILYGCKVLSQSQGYLKRKTALRGQNLLRAAVAGYNCGAGNVRRAIELGHDVDYFTHGRDYSADVLNRTGFFLRAGWA